MDKFALTVLLLLSAPAYADGVDNKEIAFDALLMADYLQTRTIIRRPDLWQENNPILGRHPSNKALNVYMISAGVLHYAISQSLNARWKNVWQNMSIIIQGENVLRNYTVGIAMSF